VNDLPESEVRALIVLLGDDNDWTAGVARERLLAAGSSAVPQLLQAANASNIRLRGRARRLLQSIRLAGLADEFRAYSGRPDSDLELLDGAFLVAEVNYPDLDRDRLLAAISTMESDARRAVAGGHSIHEFLGSVGHALYEVHGFGGDREEFHNPDNSFVNRVIERKKGNPITLSILYMELAARIGLPMVGIGMPGHFVVRPRGAEDLFIDPFNQGRLLTREDCIRFLGEAGYGYEPSYLQPLRVRSILARMLSGLVRVYSEREDHDRASRFASFFQIVLQRESPI